MTDDSYISNYKIFLAMFYLRADLWIEVSQPYEWLFIPYTYEKTHMTHCEMKCHYGY